MEQRRLRALIVEDNQDITANLYAFLEPLGYELDCAATGTAGLELAARRNLRRHRSGHHAARHGRPCRMPCAAHALYRGNSDSYAYCPRYGGGPRHRAGCRSGRLSHQTLFHERTGRPPACAGSAGAGATNTLRAPLGDIELDPAAHSASRSGTPLKLSPTGFTILETLLRAAPRIVSRAELEREIWGDAPPDSDALRTHIHELRQKLDKPFAHPLLKTVPHVGYGLSDSL